MACSVASLRCSSCSTHRPTSRVTARNLGAAEVAQQGPEIAAMFSELVVDQFLHFVVGMLSLRALTLAADQGRQGGFDCVGCVLAQTADALQL